MLRYVIVGMNNLSDLRYVTLCYCRHEQLIRLTFVFVNSPKRESGLRGVVSLLPTVTTPFCVGVPVKRQRPISISIEMLHLTFALPGLTFQSDSCANIIKV